MIDWIKKADEYIDSAFEATGLPSAVGAGMGYLGSGFDALAGTNIAPTVERVGRELPRTIVEGLATIPAAATGVGAPAAVGSWLNRLRKVGQAAGYTSAFTRGVDDTDSLAGGAISAATLGLGNKLFLPASRGGIDVGQQAATGIERWLNRGTPDLTRKAGQSLDEIAGGIRPATTRERNLPFAGRVAADLGVGTALNEAQRQATMSVGPHAVGWDDPSRNPLTAENIAGNVVNAVSYTPQAVTAYRNRPLKNVKQTNQYAQEYLDRARNLGKTYLDRSVVESPDLSMPKRYELVLGQMLSNERQFRLEGKVQDADNTLRGLKGFLENMSPGRVDPKYIRDVATKLEERTRLMPPENQQEWDKFIEDYNALVDMYYQGKQTIDERLGEEMPVRPDEIRVHQGQKTPEQLARILSAKEESARLWKERDEMTAELEKQKGKTWHPNAAPREVIERLASRGLLPKLTPETLEKDYNFFFDRSIGDPDHARRAVLQRHVNRLMDELPTALKREEAEWKTPADVKETEMSPKALERKRALDKTFVDFRQGLKSLEDVLQPDDYQKLIARTVDISSRPDKFVDLYGRFTNIQASWFRSVALAGATYNPVLRTVKVWQGRKKPPREIPIAYFLGEKDPKTGKFLWSPKESVISLAEGGRSKIESSSLQDVTLSGKTREDVIGEEYEGFDELLVSEKAREQFQGSMAEKEAVDPEGGIEKTLDTIDEPSNQQINTQRFAGLTKLVQTSLKELNDKQLYTAVQDVFSRASTGVGSTGQDNLRWYRREGGLRKAVTAAMENYAFFDKEDVKEVGPAGQAFLDAEKARGVKLQGASPKAQLYNALRVFFWDSSLKGKGDRVWLTKLGRVIDRLGDPRVVKMVKEGPGTKMMPVGEGGGEEPLIKFSGPVRLRRWLAKPGMGYTPDAQGMLAVERVEPLMRRLGVTEAELEIYRAAGLAGMLTKGRVKVEELARWMEEKAPRVEVRELRPGQFDEIGRQAASAQHVLETAGYTFVPSTDEAFTSTEARLFHERTGAEVRLDQLPPNERAAADFFFQHEDRWGAGDIEGGDKQASDAATGRYGVEPKELKDMPGAVDILVRVPAKYNRTPEEMVRSNNPSVLFRGPHFGDSDVNVLASVRGYLETLPSGEKVFHVFEVQSDWGQRRGEEQQRRQRILRDTGRDPNMYPESGVGTKDHPLLAVYEQLALKAAIRHARKVGAKYVAVSDAETAMMTEGHDRNVEPLTKPLSKESAQSHLEDFLRSNPSQKDRLYLAQVSEGKWVLAQRITQEPGMRAAYDDRLPRTMEKLTQVKGVEVGFGVHKNAGIPDYEQPDPSEGLPRIVPTGSPVFKNRDGTPKSSITARLYDITRAPDEFAAFGYTKPQPGAGPDVSPQSGIRDTFVNDPAEGAFVQDVGKTLHATLHRVLGDKGYSGSYRDMLTTLGVTIARQMGDVPVDFYRVGGDEAGLATVKDGRGKIGINIDTPPINPEKMHQYVIGLLETLQHEITHIDQYIIQGLIEAPDAYSHQRRQMKEQVLHLGKTLTPDEREAFIITLEEGLRPEDYRKRLREPKVDPATGTRRRYGTNDPDEFMSELDRLLLMPLLGGKSSHVRTAMEVLDYSPTEVRQYAQTTYRTIADTMEAMKETIQDPSVRAALGKDALPPLVDKVFASAAFQTVVDTAHLASQLRDADVAIAQGRQVFEAMSPGGRIPLEPTNALWIRTAEDLKKTYGPEVKLSPSAEAAVEEVSSFLAGRSPLTSKFAEWVTPFQNLMFNLERQGITLARPLANLALGLEPGVRRQRTEMLRPFVITKPTGHVEFRQENALIQLITEGTLGPWRDAVNRLSAWQQENGTQSIFLRDDKGQVIVNEKLKGAKDEWDKVRSQLSPENAQKVASAMVAMDETFQIAAQRLVASIDISNRHRVAMLLRVMNRQMPYEQTLALADQLVGGYMKGDVSSVVRTGLPQEQIVQVSSLLNGPEGLLAKFQEVQEKLLNRPGFRTESLTGDFLVKFKTPDGEVKFLSADTQHKANLLARRLTQEDNTVGKIVDKDELKNYTDFDSPDTLLAKFTEVESSVWDRFVREVEEKHGGLFNQELIQELKGFTVGTATSRELGVKGMGQFTKERKNQVDRTRYDYISGMLEWTGRLATSMEYKNIRQMKDIILADPRAKGQPELGRLVEPYFEHLLTPTGQGEREVKAFSSAMMMGLNLSSVIIDGTQSISTLVPTLIQLASKDGPIAAYRLLGRALADVTGSIVSSSKWNKFTQEAERTDPSKWTLEQAKAALLKRSIEDGGVNHGIIQENIFTPTDQRVALMAKFGRGKYDGGSSVGEMARSGLYIASQLSLKPFGWIEAFNNKVALMAGIEQGYEKKLRGEALYDHAKLVGVLSNFGGGKANAPGLVSKLSTSYTRSAVGVLNTLQQYGYGVLASYSQLIKDSLGRSAGLSPQERRQAQKAFGTMLATQVALGGALGLPFVAASLTLLEKIFGIPANQLVREGLASLGSDEDEGAVIAETALNGIGNQLFGLDLSSRMGVSNLLGTSAYRGFNLADMVGPVGSIVENAAQALNWFGQKEPLKAAKALVPVSMKTLVDMADTKEKYGDLGFRDSGGNLLYQPTSGQAFGYALGFRPRELSQKRQAQRLLQTANERASQSRDRELDSVSRDLLAGNPTQAIRYAQNARYADPTVDASAILRSVVQRAVDSRTEKDLLASGPSSNENERRRIVGTFGSGIVNRQSELQRQQMKAQLGARLGLQPDPKDFEKAAMVDVLVQGQGMPRSQALRLVEFLR